MKSASKLLAALIMTVSLTTPGTSSIAQQEASDDKTLSPYFFVKSDNPEVDRLPLKSTSAAVNIAGVIADVKVIQVYKNEGRQALEAIYIFPGSTRAAVYAMKMTIGERIIKAKIKKRDEARQEYEQAKQQGKTASLLEQQRPNVFQMNVANILPGDLIKVEMSYTELLVPTDKVYDFVYPAVVGPRYSNKPAAATPVSEHWVRNPYLHQGGPAPCAFDISVALNAGLPIQKLVCGTHKVNVSYQDSSRAEVSLDKPEAQGGNRDYILKYRLAGDQVESGLLLSSGEKENFFLLMVQPPKRITLAQIPGREYIFIVDVSGSMYGFPLDISKKLLRDLIGNLRPTDLFNVVLFAGGSTIMSERSVPATVDNINRAVNIIDRQHGGGGTELLPALERSLKLPGTEGYSRTIVIATDGYVHVEEQAFDLMRNNLGNANMFAFGIGSSVNRHLIEGMAHVGMGEPFVITKPDEASAKAEAFRTLIQSPVLTRVTVDFDGFDAYDVEPKSVPDVLADRPVVVFGKWRGQAHGKIKLSGISGERRYEEIVDISQAAVKANDALRYLWARHRINILSDYNMLRQSDERIAEVTNLGLAYNLLTAYTSFVAVDSGARNADGKQTTVNQPLPMPQGVSDFAVGGGIIAKSAMPLMTAPAAPAEMRELRSVAGSGYARRGQVTTKDKADQGVTIEELIVTGALSKEAVGKAIAQQVQALQSCMKGPARLRIKLAVNPDGTVKSAEFDSKTSEKSKEQQCALEMIGKWKFGASSGKKTVFTLTLSFK